MSLNTSADSKPWRAPRPSSRCRMRSRNAAICVGVDGLHRALELALVCLQRMQLGVDEAGDVLDVVGLVGLPQQQRVGSVVGEAVLLEEVRVAGGDDALARQQAGVRDGRGAAGSASTGRGRARPAGAAAG